jgi:two-component system invasion response regulator UvrY
VFSRVKIENQIINEETVSILIADDRKLVREAWRCILNKNGRFRIVSECNNWESALIQAKRLHPDVIILNIGPPDLSGIEMIPLLIKYVPNSKIIAVSVYTFPNIAIQLIQAGASAYVTKTSPIQELLDAVNVVREEGKYVCREIKRMPREHVEYREEFESKWLHLSIREVEVIAGMRNRMSLQEIAEHLRIRQKMVEGFLFETLKTFQLKNIAELSAFLVENHQYLKEACQDS